MPSEDTEIKDAKSAVRVVVLMKAAEVVVKAKVLTGNLRLPFGMENLLYSYLLITWFSCRLLAHCP